MNQPASAFEAPSAVLYPDGGDPTGVRQHRVATYRKSPEQKKKEFVAFLYMPLIITICAGIGYGAYELTDSKIAGILAYLGSGIGLGAVYALMASEYTDDDSTY